jgi:cellulose synthase/poly-beta-1,6-N-acetylglucosamine synthase-like glycosyltransferase
MTFQKLFEVYSAIAGIGWIGIIVYVLIGFKKIKLLPQQPVAEVEPAVAIIIAVRNEEEDVEKALQSICHINYSNYRIIVLNDRSTDSTGAILERMKIMYPAINVIAINTLPDGWLGKNNALYQGYLQSTEEWMLFTDADIVFHPDALSRAMGYVEKHNLDHLTIFPQTVSRSVMLNSVLATFALMLVLYIRPWDVRNPKRKAAMGVGAFNLVKRTAYEKAGTHAPISLRPDDDLKLGQLIKQAGFRSDVLSGKEYLTLEWYKTLKQFRDGLMKNSFSISNYKLSGAIVNALASFVCIGLPVPLMLIFGSASVQIAACAIIVFQMIYMELTSPNKWWYALVIPFAGALMAYVVMRAAILTLKQGGIYWRDSFYSLAELKSQSK